MTTPDRIVAMVRERAEVGVKKYGVTVDRDDLTLAQWVRHAQEEQLDAAQYLQRVLETFEKEIENAYREGYTQCAEHNHEYILSCSPAERNQAWRNSRAKRIAEGGR